MRSCYFTGFILLLLGVNLQAQVSAKAALDSADIMIGDQVKLHLSAEFNEKDTKIKGFDLSPLDSIKHVEVVRVQPANTPVAGLWQQDLLVTAFDSGAYLLPPLVLRFERNGQMDSALTNDVLLQVRTIPMEGDSIALQPIKDIIVEPRTWQDFIPGIAIAVGLIIAGLVGYWLWRRPKREIQVQREAPPLPAHQIALQKLAALKKAGYWERGELKLYYSELTFILREYLESRFKIQALESTTDEILAAIKSLGFNDEQKEATSQLLQTADLVKFAKAMPPPDSHAGQLDAAVALVEATQPAVVETPEPEKEA